jgi:hypothetical protein
MTSSTDTDLQNILLDARCRCQQRSPSPRKGIRWSTQASTPPQPGNTDRQQPRQLSCPEKDVGSAALEPCYLIGACPGVECVPSAGVQVKAFHALPATRSTTRRGDLTLFISGTQSTGRSAKAKREIFSTSELAL